MCLCVVGLQQQEAGLIQSPVMHEGSIQGHHDYSDPPLATADHEAASISQPSSHASLNQDLQAPPPPSQDYPATPVSQGYPVEPTPSSVSSNLYPNTAGSDTSRDAQVYSSKDHMFPNFGYSSSSSNSTQAIEHFVEKSFPATRTSESASVICHSSSVSNMALGAGPRIVDPNPTSQSLHSSSTRIADPISSVSAPFPSLHFTEDHISRDRISAGRDLSSQVPTPWPVSTFTDSAGSFMPSFSSRPTPQSAVLSNHGQFPTRGFPEPPNTFARTWSPAVSKHNYPTNPLSHYPSDVHAGATGYSDPTSFGSQRDMLSPQRDPLAAQREILSSPRATPLTHDFTGSLWPTRDARATTFSPRPSTPLQPSSYPMPGMTNPHTAQPHASWGAHPSDLYKQSFATPNPYTTHQMPPPVPGSARPWPWGSHQAVRDTPMPGVPGVPGAASHMQQFQYGAWGGMYQGRGGEGMYGYPGIDAGSTAMSPYYHPWTTDRGANPQ